MNKGDRDTWVDTFSVASQYLPWCHVKSEEMGGYMSSIESTSCLPQVQSVNNNSYLKG